MRKAYSYLVAFVAAVISLAATGCFTGIESTPKITAENVKESGVRVSDEQKFAEKIVPEAPSTWKIGKKWLVADSKIALVFTPASDKADSLAGEEISLVEIRTATTLTGEEAIELVLAAPDGRIFFHRTGLSEADWKSKASYAIPFTVELSAVELADSLLKGNTYYITTPRWYAADGNDFTGLRHVPVTVQAVRPGNHLYPLLVAFTQPERPLEPVRYILMTYGNEASSTRNFDRLFSFSNPRKLYPNISNDTWQKIIHSQLAEGMTRDECRLALGTPDSIDRATTVGNTHFERWSYENGVYLLFEDGYLSKFRM